MNELIMELIPTTVYHGTTTKKFESVFQGINLDKCTRYADFGKAFYTTPDLNVAYRWSNKRAEDYNEQVKNDFAQGVVLTFDIDPIIFLRLRGKVFRYPSFEWIKFIYKNRSSINFTTHDYNFVFGEIADGKIQKLIADKDCGTINFTKLHRLAKFRHSSDFQLSFNTYEALKSLKLRNEVRYYEDFKKANVNAGV